MTNEERDIIAKFVARVSGAPGGFGSVPSTAALPPVDHEADQLLGELFAKYPEARYRITQTAFAEEAALAEAHKRLEAMQAEIAQLRQQVQAPPASPSSGQSRGFLGGLFGGPAQPAAPQYASQPQYAPQPQYAAGSSQGMFGGGGSGFVGSALRTAAGVAGGMLAAEAITGMFSPHSYGGFGGGGFGGGFGGGGFGGNEVINETTVNNYGSQDAGGGGGDPWAGAGGVDPQGGGFDNAAPDNSAFDSGGGGGGGGDWDSGGGDSF